MLNEGKGIRTKENKNQLTNSDCVRKMLLFILRCSRFGLARWIHVESRLRTRAKSGADPSIIKKGLASYRNYNRESAQAMSKALEEGHRGSMAAKRSVIYKNAPRYRCIACGRPRSSRFHSRHPPEDPPPPQGICRRCIGTERKENLPLTPEIKIYEFHYYHHDCTCTHEQPCRRSAVERSRTLGYPSCAELPAEDITGRTPPPYRPTERVPPPVAFWRKPSLWRSSSSK
mgnify:FL=1